LACDVRKAPVESGVETPPQTTPKEAAMEDNKRESRRDRLGYGSTYRRGGAGKSGGREIPAVLGGRTWMVKPDRRASAPRPCLWMRAGAVKFKNCSHHYDCASCGYDRAMSARAAEGRQIRWQEAMRRRPDMDRLCRHALTGRSVPRACAANYECGRCEFDQLFEEVLSVRAARPPEARQRLRGFEVPMGHGFHEGHAWARLEDGGMVRVGLDDFALKLFGKPDAFELPLMGRTFEPGQIGWGLRRGENRADVRAPVGGVIVEVNPGARADAAVANRHPYGDGWLFMVRTPEPKAAVAALRADEAGLDWMAAEIDRLEALVEEVAGPLTADGGVLAEDIIGNLPGLDWRRLAQSFLRT
jgi:glycine cleavage system H lipoate-binding protein